MGNLGEPLKEEEAKAETAWQWWTDYKGESFSPHIMLYGPNGTRMLGNGVAIALELTRLEAEVKALKPLAELAGKIEPWLRRVNSHQSATNITVPKDAFADWLAHYDSALKAQGEQSNPSEEER